MNILTKKVRQIRRQEFTGDRWQYHDGYWADMSPEQCAVVSAAVARKAATAEFSYGKTKYLVDLAAMSQTNTTTGFSRRIRKFDPILASRKTTHSAGGAHGPRAVQFSSVRVVLTDPPKGDGATDVSTFFVEGVVPDMTEDDCPICLCKLDGVDGTVVSLAQCTRHVFHKECIMGAVQGGSLRCPSCSKIYGVVIGDCPDATMMISEDPTIHLAGQPSGALVVTFRVPGGVQTQGHPNPGTMFDGTERQAFFPNSPEGTALCSMVEVAFKRRLVFTVGRSMTTGRDNCVVWNGLHMKTSPSGAHGYPDDTYLTRLEEELNAKGVFR